MACFIDAPERAKFWEAHVSQAERNWQGATHIWPQTETVVT